MLVAGLFNFLGFLVCFVGIFVTAPITMLATAMMYDLLCAHKGLGLRNPEYVHEYWQDTTAEGQPPLVGPIPEAQTVEGGQVAAVVDMRVAEEDAVNSGRVHGGVAVLLEGLLPAALHHAAV